MLKRTAIPCWRLLAVALFLGILFATFELSGLRAHFNLQFLHERFLEHRLGGLLIFVLLFALGNLIQIPGWMPVFRLSRPAAAARLATVIVR